MSFYTIMRKSATRDFELVRAKLTSEFMDYATLSKLTGLSRVAIQNCIAYAMELGLVEFKYTLARSGGTQLKTLVRRKQS